MQIRDRVKEFRRVKASDLLVNPKNWRTHPQEQFDALHSVLSDIGFAGAELVRELPDGSLELIDGHARKSIAGDAVVPVLVLDVDEAEADKLLATLDPLSAMAGVDGQKLNDLLLSFESANDSLKSMLAELAQDSIQEAEPETAKETLSNQSDALQEFIEKRKKSLERGTDKSEQNFWLCMVFQSWEQKQEFLFAIQHVPVLYGMYADGQTLASSVGISVTPNQQKPITSPLDKKLAALVSESIQS